jgi:hypothetical protein
VTVISSVIGGAFCNAPSPCVERRATRDLFGVLPVRKIVVHEVRPWLESLLALIGLSPWNPYAMIQPPQDVALLSVSSDKKI